MKLSKAAASASAKRRTVSTSQGRATLAASLQTVRDEKTIIGFARYTQSVAVLAPIEAVHMLAGQGDAIEPSVRDKIERMARAFLHTFVGRKSRVARAPAQPTRPAMGARSAKSAKSAKSVRGAKSAKSAKKKTGRGPRAKVS